MLMIGVFICEDRDEQRDKITKIIGNYILMEDLAMKVMFATPRPHELIKQIEENKVVDGLYFLGIDLAADITGIELAAKIRKHDKRGMIAFVTSDRNSIKLIFKHRVEAINYIDKENVEHMEREIKECIDLAQERLVENKEKRFLFKIDGKISSTAYSEILYFEKSSINKNKTMMVTTKGLFEFYKTLKEIESVHQSFYRIGGSYVINMDNVKTFVKNECKVVMVNDLECFIPPKRVKLFECFFKKCINR